MCFSIWTPCKGNATSEAIRHSKTPGRVYQYAVPEKEMLQSVSLPSASLQSERLLWVMTPSSREIAGAKNNSKFEFAFTYSWLLLPQDV